jgi:YbbR domain-containing protein
MRFLRVNIGYKLLALVLSVALWANVKLHQEPLTTAQQIRLEMRGVPDGLVASSGVSQVTAVLYGPKVYVTRLTPEDLTAFVALRGAAAGHYKKDVIVQVPRNLQSLVTVQTVTPAQVDVRVRRKTRKTVPVRVQWIGEPPSGARYGPARISPQTVDVAGADTAVDMVDHAEIRVQAGDPHVTGRFPVVPVDGRGETVSEISTWPDGVTLDATLRATEGRQQAFVSPAYHGSPANGFEIVGVYTNPQVVTLVGSPATLENLKSITTQSIAIAGATGDISRRVPLLLPRDVTAEPALVEARIRIRKAP